MKVNDLILLLEAAACSPHVVYVGAPYGEAKKRLLGFNLLEEDPQHVGDVRITSAGERFVERLLAVEPEVEVRLQKKIRFFGQERVLACDGRCDKAWGIGKRPKLFFQDLKKPRALREGEEPRDEDDYVFVGDDELGTAPADPGTYECDDAKPSAVPLTDPALMNKWCARECERQHKFKPGEKIVLQDMRCPNPNRFDRR